MYNTEPMSAECAMFQRRTKMQCSDWLAATRGNLEYDANASVRTALTRYKQ